MQVYPSPDYLVIAYRNDLQLLVARWLRPVSPIETREGYELILQAAQHFGTPFWLLDGRRRLPADEPTTQWGLHEFFPTLSAQLGQQVCMSQLLSPYYQAITEAMPVFQELERQPAQLYRMRRFNDEALAVEWLRECQQEASLSSQK